MCLSALSSEIHRVYEKLLEVDDILIKEHASNPSGQLFTESVGNNLINRVANELFPVVGIGQSLKLSLVDHW